MLCSRFSTPLDAIKHIKDDQVFWIQTKFDGERIQLHKSGQEYRYWSRNATDYTYLYGSSPSTGSLTPFIHSLFTPGIQR